MIIEVIAQVNTKLIHKCECELVLLYTPDIPTLRDILCFITTQAQQHTTKGVLTPNLGKATGVHWLLIWVFPY